MIHLTELDPMDKHPLALGLRKTDGRLRMFCEGMLTLNEIYGVCGFKANLDEIRVDLPYGKDPPSPEVVEWLSERGWHLCGLDEGEPNFTSFYCGG